MAYDITYNSNVPNAIQVATHEMETSIASVKEAFFSGDVVADAKSYYGSQCIFKEWNTSSNGTGTAYAAGDAPSSNVTIYAIWQADTIKPETLDFVTPGALYQLNNLTDAERTKIANAITQSQVQEYDAKDFSDWQEWVSGTSYVEGDKVKVTDGDDVDGYICIDDNSSSSILPEEWETATCFPEDGEADTLYIDKSANTSYYWNGTEYVSVGGEYAVFTGATSSAAGTAGLVPAPFAGDQIKVLMGDGTWDIAPGARVVDVTATVTNTSGSYSHTFEDEDVTSEMVAMRIAIGNAKAFRGKISVTPGDGEYTISCPNVAGTSTMTVYFVKQQQNPTQITSTEFDILNNRLLAVENVCTTTPVTIATTDWTLSSGTYSYTWESSLITAACGAEVLLQDGAESAGISGFNVEKVTGGIQLTTTETPTGNLPVIFKVINTKSDEIQNLTGDDIASDAISGCSNVDAALTNLDGRLGNVPSGKTAQGQIDTLNSNIANMIAQTDSATYVRFNNSSTNTEYRLNVTQDGQLLLGSRVGSGNWNLIDITSAIEFGTDKAFTGDIDSTNITPGQYHLGSSSSYTHASITSNVPDYCIFVQYSYAKMQVIFEGNYIMTRKYTGSPASWSTWKRIE